MKYLPSVVSGLLACLAGTMTIAGEPAPAEPAQQVAFDIRSQPLGEALDEFSRHSHVRVVVESALGEGITAALLSGTYTSSGALEKLLCSTGLKFEYLDERTVAITAPVHARASGVDAKMPVSPGSLLAQSTPSPVSA